MQLFLRFSKVFDVQISNPAQLRHAPFMPGSVAAGPFECVSAAPYLMLDLTDLLRQGVDRAVVQFSGSKGSPVQRRPQHGGPGLVSAQRTNGLDINPRLHHCHGSIISMLSE